MRGGEYVSTPMDTHCHPYLRRAIKIDPTVLVEIYDLEMDRANEHKHYSTVIDTIVHYLLHDQIDVKSDTQQSYFQQYEG